MTAVAFLAKFGLAAVEDVPFYLRLIVNDAGRDWQDRLDAAAHLLAHEAAAAVVGDAGADAVLGDQAAIVGALGGASIDTDAALYGGGVAP